MNKIKLLFADDLHFHKRNFKSLFKFIEKNNIEHSFMQPKKSMLSAFGNYYSFRKELSKYNFQIEELTFQEILNYTYKGINIFNICRSEMLSCLLPRNNWRKDKVSSSNSFIIKKAYDENFEELCLNMSAGLYWVDFWINELQKYKIHDYCCIFSGSNTYSKALIEVLKTHITNPIIMESFFTGNEYYMEFKYDSLPNNSDLSFKNIFNSYNLPKSIYEYNNLKIKAINKVVCAKNKNVKQPKENMSEFSQIPDSYILIAGQVLNDYSIINTQKQLNSIETYKEIINVLLKNTNNNIVFKAHPWEEQKDNISYALTFNELVKYRKLLPKLDRNRLFIVNHINLNQLINNADGFVTICSQSAFEAALNGLKPITIGGAFFDNYGFTSSFPTCHDFEISLKEQDLNFDLSLVEFEKLENYLIVALCYHLICVHDSGLSQLKNLFNKPVIIEKVGEFKQSIVFDNNVELFNCEMTTDEKNVLNSLDKSIQESFSNLEKKINTSLQDIKNPQKQDSIQKKQNNKKNMFSNQFIEIENKMVRNIGTTRLYKKYMNDRFRFFEDVQNPLVKKYWKKLGSKL